MKKSFLYTRTGDKGSTSLVGGMRVAKNSPRVCAYGDVDELNAEIGLVASVAASERGAEHDVALLTHVSYVMFNIGAHLASPPDPHLPTASEAPVSDGEIIALEQRIDTLDALLPPQRTFILPGGSVAASHAHVARTVCRRAERSILTLIDVEGECVHPSVLTYINRLSDYLFILARALNNMAGVADIPWVKSSEF